MPTFVWIKTMAQIELFGFFANMHSKMYETTYQYYIKLRYIDWFLKWNSIIHKNKQINQRTVHENK